MNRESFIAVATLTGLVSLGLLLACSEKKEAGTQSTTAFTEPPTPTAKAGGTPLMESDPKNMLLTIRPLQSFDLQGVVHRDAIETDRHGNIYHLSPSNHSIAVYDKEMRLTGRIGRAGQAPGELHDPIELAIGPSGTVYVADGGNRRVQIFDKAGQFIGGFQVDYIPRAIAVNSRNEIFLNGNHSREKKIEVYSADGKLLRAFGEPCKVDFSKLTKEKLSEDYMKKVIASHSSGILATDQDDNIYFAFNSGPFLRKYDRFGTLLFEIEITGGRMEKEIAEATEAFKEKIKQGRTGYRVVMSDLVVDPQTGNVWVAPMNHLFIYNSEGKKLAELNLVEAEGKKAVPQKLALQRDRLIGLRFPSTLYIFPKPL